MTTNPQPPGPSSAPLDASEHELARLLGELPTAAPSAALDARILDAARRAVAPAPRRRKLSWWRSVGLGAAASVVVAVGLLVHLRGVGPEASMPAARLAPAEESAAAPQASRIDGSAAGHPDARQNVASPSPREVAPPPPSAMPLKPPPPAPPPPTMPAPAIVPAEEALPVEAPAKAFPRETAPAPVSKAPAGNLRDEDATPAPPPPPPASAPITMAPTAAADAAVQPKAAPAPAAAGAFDRARTDALRVSQEPASMDELGAAASKEKSARRGVGKPEADAGFAKQAAPVAQSGAAAPTLARIPVADDARLAPGAWLERIRARQAAGDTAGARASLQAFRRRHPDLPIPADLQALWQ